MANTQDSTTRDGEARQCRRSSSESRLLRQLRRGDPEAFEQISHQYRHRLYRLALKILRNVQDAEDAVQETLFLAFSKIDTFAARSSLYTWLTRILVNSCFMQLRKGKRAALFSLDDPAAEGGTAWLETLAFKTPPADEVLVLEEELTVLREAVSRLRPDLQIILAARYEDDLPMAVIAAQLDLSISATKSRASRARQVCARNMRQIAKARSNAGPRSARMMV